MPTPNTPEAWADMIDNFQNEALHTRLGIPLLYGVDSVHGHANLLGATVFPHNIGLGATRDPKLVKRIEDITAQETRASGPQWAFGPCICVARDDRWGRTYESFSEAPRLVSKMTVAIEGFQGGNGSVDRTHVLASAKHFAGDGLTSYNDDERRAPTPSTRGSTRSSAPPSTSWHWRRTGRRWPAQRAHRDAVVLERRLDRGRLGQPGEDAREQGADHRCPQALLRFKGFVISDWQAITQLPVTTPPRCRRR